MKKNYYKVSSFFTEKRSTIIIILFILCVLFIPKNTYALSLNYTDFRTQSFSEGLSSSLNRFLNFDNLVYWVNNNGMPNNNSSNFYILPINISSNYTICSTPTGSYYNLMGYDLNTNTSFNLKHLRTTIDYINASDNFTTMDQLFTQFGSIQSITNTSYYMSSVDIYSCSDMSVKVISKNFDYTPQSSGVSCPECEECPSSGEEGECGPVEVSNFPLDKTDFYTLLVLLGVLIIMIFFKWCFPMKGGKKQ